MFDRVFFLKFKKGPKGPLKIIRKKERFGIFVHSRYRRCYASCVQLKDRLIGILSRFIEYFYLQLLLNLFCILHSAFMSRLIELLFDRAFIFLHRDYRHCSRAFFSAFAIASVSLNAFCNHGSIVRTLFLVG